MPEAYGTGRLLLTARDPRCLYAHWDLTAEQQGHYNALSLHHHLMVRVHVDEAGGQTVSEVRVQPEARHCFISVGRGGLKYAAELGYYRSDGGWIGVATSEPVATPPEGEAAERAVQFATIRLEMPLGQTAAQIAESVSTAPPSGPEVRLHEGPLRVEGVAFPRPVLPGREQNQSSGVQRQGDAVSEPGWDAAALMRDEWSVAQEQALSEAMGPALVRREWLGSAGVEELTSLPADRDVSSIAAAQFGWPGAEISSPQGGAPPGRQGFWLNVNAELVVYGATEPDAWVTIGGRPIQLRPDGTFSYRFALPDGSYELPIVAVSMPGEVRQAKLHFQRSTSSGGEVGAHPQDPALRTPSPEHVT